MASLILSNASGGQNILSGSFYSGTTYGQPVLGEIRLRLDQTASGNAYVGPQGGITVTSGVLAASGQPNAGSGLADGFLLRPTDSVPLAIPRFALGQSGLPSLFVATDPAASGQARLYYWIF